MTAVAACFLAMLVGHLLTPFWWWVMVVPFAFGAAFARRGWPAFRTGAVSAGPLWLGAAACYALTGAGAVAGRMARMLKLGSPVLLVLITGLLAALAAGISSYAGFAVRTLFQGTGVRDTPGS